jgi:hypothetical protein
MSTKVRRPDAARRQAVVAAAAAVTVGFTADRNQTICDVAWTAERAGLVAPVISSSKARVLVPNREFRVVWL